MMYTDIYYPYIAEVGGDPMVENNAEKRRTPYRSSTLNSFSDQLQDMLSDFRSQVALEKALSDERAKLDTPAHPLLELVFGRLLGLKKAKTAHPPSNKQEMYITRIRGFRRDLNTVQETDAEASDADIAAFRSVLDSAEKEITAKFAEIG